LVLIGYTATDMPKEFPHNVLVLQNVAHANVMEAWERCLFGVIPSLWPDPSPGVVREAMSKGKAVIVTSVGGSTEMIGENQNGLLVPPGDVDELVQAMKCMIDHDDLREQLGQAGLEWSKQYMAEAVVPQFEQLYRQVIYKQFSLEIPLAGD
jgi:glycosyltransferase involved in cell wall biosynthesis